MYFFPIKIFGSIVINKCPTFWGPLKSSKGKADVFGMDTFSNFSSIKPKISIVPEQESPPSFLTPREVLELVVNIRQISDSNIDYWLEFFELEVHVYNIYKGSKKID